MKLTLNRIDSLKCPEGNRDVLVCEQRGLGERVTAGGSKTYLAPLPRPALEGVRVLAPGPHFEVLVHMRGNPGFRGCVRAMCHGEREQDRTGERRHDLQRGHRKGYRWAAVCDALNGLLHCRAGKFRLLDEDHAFDANEMGAEVFARESKVRIPV